MAAAPAPASAPDLIHALSLPISVSSTVANNTERPDHLVDGSLETAWNSRTGQAEGSTINVWVPPGATVSQLRMTAGYTRSTARGDLFTQNLRVQRVHVYFVPFAGEPVRREFDLDANNRGLQSFALGTGGGRYQISLRNLLPGSQRNWTEACVSEFQLVGTGSNPPWMLPEPLFVGVGEPPQNPQAVTGPYANPQAACPVLQRERDRRRCREFPGSCECTVDSPVRLVTTELRGASPASGVRLVRSSNSPDEGPTCSLMVQTSAGWFNVGSLGTCGRPDPTSHNSAAYARASVELRQAAVRNGPNAEAVLRVAYDSDFGNYEMDGYDEANDRGTRWADRERHSRAIQCHFTASGQPECTGTRFTAPSRVERH